MTTLPLEGQTALVTGAGRGIGRAIAVALAEAGADVCVNHYGLLPDAEATIEAVRKTGRKAWRVEADVSDQAAVEKMVKDLVAETGRLDIAVLNAYFSDREPFLTANMPGFRRTIDVTMWGAFYALRASAQAMIDTKRKGSIVAISSPHAIIPFAKAMAYNMAKAAIDQMCRTAAVELLEERIRVNILHPGWIDTPGERKYYSDEEMNAVGAKLPWGRLGRPEEIGHGVVFLCDPRSDYVTGTTLSMEGGITLPWMQRKGGANPNQD